MTKEWTLEEWRRHVASLEESGRILQASIDEMQANADMLRERGHEFLAEVLEHSVRKEQVRLDEMHKLVEDWREEGLL
jgi:hypothetical protein